MDHAERTHRLGTQPIGRFLLELSAPAIAAAMINASHNLVNRYFVGQYLGPDAMAAVTISIPLTTIMLAIGMMVSIGAGTLISIRLGEKNYHEAERVVGLALFLFLILSVGFLIFGLVCQGTMYRFMRINEDVIPFARQYISVLVCGTFFHEISFGVNGFLRAEGKARTAMVTTLIAALLNIFFRGGGA